MMKCPFAAAMGALIFALLVGCQVQPHTQLSALPPPSFNPPSIAQAAPAPPAPAPPPPHAQWTPPSHVEIPDWRNPNHDYTPAPAYVSDATRDRLLRLADGADSWIPRAPTRPWRWIVIHHSASDVGGARLFDKEHRAKGWDELGYDFVIGNGSDTRDGQIEVGPRWPVQKWGAHAKTPNEQYNNYGIGICLVGNFDIQYPSRRQLDSLARLCAYLMITYRIPPDNVLFHRDTKPTDCPGKHMHRAQMRDMAEAYIKRWGYDPWTLAGK